MRSLGYIPQLCGFYKKIGASSPAPILTIVPAVTKPKKSEAADSLGGAIICSDKELPRGYVRDNAHQFSTATRVNDMTYVTSFRQASMYDSVSAAYRRSLSSV